MDARVSMALIVFGGLTALLLGLAVARWWAARTLAEDLPGLDDELDTEVQDVRPALPAGHRPPQGLGPISPSERFLSAEAERGLRDLEVYLLDVA
jgi:hypothetical protein